MYPWCIDAREVIKDVSDIDDDLIEETKEIKDFLHQERYYFVIATKGFGKSLLLLAKRKNLRGVEYIPQNLLIDVPELSLDDIGHDMLSIIYEKGTMPLVWSISIIIAIIKNLKMTDDILKFNISVSLKNLLIQEKYTVSDYFGTILKSIHRGQFFKELAYDYSDTLVPVARRIEKHVAVFIDNVDECFEKFNDRELWYIAQNSLMQSIYKLVRLNPGKIKLYASIRKEAFLKLRSETEMFQQYKGVSLDLSYFKDELKQIFIKNINKDKKENLLHKDLVREQPILAFLGVERISHDHVNEEEDIFDYIYRHTLKRPRDLMEIGRIITRCPVSERNPNHSAGIHKLKQLVNDAGTEIANEYISEILPHLTIDKKNLEKLFSLINSNIIKKDEVKTICMKFNGNDAECLRTDCKSCKKMHIFCELFKVGLLGYVVENTPKTSEYIQKFTIIGEKMFDEVRLLPESSHYLIHPVLDWLISEKNSEYKDLINTTNIVGYDRVWKEEKKSAYTKDSVGAEQIKASAINDFSYNNDYTRVSLKGKEYDLSFDKAKLIKVLHEAYEKGCPVLSKKDAMEKAGLRGRFTDLFKTAKEVKQALIAEENNRRSCRLNI